MLALNAAHQVPFSALRGGRVAQAFLASVLLAAAPLPAASAFTEDPAATSPEEQDLKRLSLEQLGQVQVTSVTKEPEQVWKTPAAVFVLTQEDIRRSGATSIPEALRLVPGVEVARIDSDHWSIAIRGFAGQFSKSLLVLIDGRSVYTPLFSGVYWNVQNLMLEDVARIEVIRGSGGTIWGANAVNGVINIITKSAKDTQGALVAAGGGNVDQATGSARYGGTAPHGVAYRVYGTGFEDSSEHHADGDAFDPWRIGQLGFRTDWTYGADNSFTIQGDLYSGRTGERVDLATFSPAAETVADDSAFVSGGNLVARWQRTTGENSDLQLQIYFDRTNFQDLELGETRDTFDFDFIRHQRLGKRQRLAWGLGARFSPSNFIQSSDGVNFLPHKQTDSIYSGFVQDEVSLLGDKLLLTAGTKLEHNNFSGFEFQPTARLLWASSDHSSFWLAAARAVRTPSRLDQDVQFNIFVENMPPPVYFLIEGSKAVSAERLFGYEAGYRRTISKRVYVDFAGFYNLYRGLQSYGALSLLAVSTPAPGHVDIVVPYVNGVEGHTIGGEIAPEARITSFWRLRGSYSYLHMSLRDAPGFTDTGAILESYLGSSPHHMAEFQSLFDLPRHSEIDLTYRHESALASGSVPRYQTVDLRWGWHLGEHVEFSVVGQNLLQPFHAEFSGDPGPLVGIRRGAYAKITWRR